jgi:hypothetical protein
MLDIATAYNRYKFLGYEFLTWLWYVMEKERNHLVQIHPELTSLEIGNRVVLENRIQEEMETILIRGDGAGFEEGMLALEKGAMVSEINLILKANEMEWRLTIKGESLDLSGLKTPETAGEEAPDEMEAAVLEKIFLYERVFQVFEALYAYFIRLRIGNSWSDPTLPAIKKWILNKTK